MPKVNFIPEGHHTITPHLVCKNAAKAIEFYKQAFGAEEVARMATPDGGIMHAELRIGNSMFYICDEYPSYGSVGPETLKGSPVTLHVYVQSVDTAFKRATDAGATATMPLQDMFWGDRFGKLKDPFGHHWSLATHTEDVTPEECARRAEKAMSQKGGCGEA